MAAPRTRTKTMPCMKEGGSPPLTPTVASQGSIELLSARTARKGDPDPGLDPDPDPDLDPADVAAKDPADAKVQIWPASAAAKGPADARVQMGLCPASAAWKTLWRG